MGTRFLNYKIKAILDTVEIRHLLDKNKTIFALLKIRYFSNWNQQLELDLW